jgi:hypothetical protein
MVCCAAGAAERGAGEEERRRDEGTGDGAKEVARAAGGKAAGARVIGGLYFCGPFGASSFLVL